MNRSESAPRTFKNPQSGNRDFLRFLNYPAELPITDRKEAVLRAIGDNQVIVITGETGSGKSTQIPKMCLEAGRGVRRMIGCTQPRRIAAVTLADRVSEELGPEGRRWVGYKIRFQDRTRATTRIKFMTDGILLAEAQSDRLFRAYDTLIIDEAHERTLNIDFLLGLIRRILPSRPDLKVIITSATIDPEKFSRAFHDAPIVEVSGRTYPVDVRYRPIEAEGPEDGEGEDVSYVDQAITAVDELKKGGTHDRRGDILVFMPTESDIREMVQRLEEKRYFNTIAMPLFGKMASADQKRIFQPTTEEKIVVATNVAETSITIPRIRYVVDTGLARIARYNTRSRTQSLPVARVSQASADQRKGRCGRVEAGVCIRLYSEEDYLGRPLYTAPEILRSNLAEVILRMLFLRLGNIQEFPFLDPPSPSAVKDGFAVLKELGAVDDHRRLTGVGRTMARLPLDPRLSRMLLQAREEGAVSEMIVLAAALSVQDPRERPLDKEAQADQAHAVFRNPRSDFTGLLKLWNLCWPRESTAEVPGTGGEPPRMDGDLPGSTEGPSPPENGTLPSGGQDQGVRYTPRSQTQLRKFCREHFLSYRRMKEWKDIHEEIGNILEEIGGFEANSAPAGYEAVHRAIVSGYLSNIAMRREKNLYLGAKNRQVMLFPGSGLFNRGGAWITAAEIVQTSRLYARIAANIEPEWLEQLGSHLCRASYFEPHWEKNRGQVAAFERVTLYGLPIVERRKINYASVHPEEARDIFIRSALVEGDLPGTYGFFQHNTDLIRQIEDLESKTRRRGLLVDEETIYGFYAERLPVLSDLRTLGRLIKDRGGDDFLRMTESDLLKVEPGSGTFERFPDVLRLGEVELPLRYTFLPGEEDDGITVTVPVHALSRLSHEPFDWLVPGMIEEKVTVLLKGLPKGLRRKLVPVADAAGRVAECLRAGEGDFFRELSRCVEEAFSVRVPSDQWLNVDLPLHLLMRFEVTGPDGNLLGTGRDLRKLKSVVVGKHEDRLWNNAKDAWEREGISSWDFGDLPPEIEIGKDALGLMRFAYPGLAAEGKTAAIRLFESPDDAKKASVEGLLLLYQLTFAAELKHLKKAWIFPERLMPMLYFMGDRQEAVRHLQDYILRGLFELHSPVVPERSRFMETVHKLEGKLGVIGNEMTGEVVEAIEEREITRSEIKRFKRSAAGNRAVRERLELIASELDELMPGNFLQDFRRELVRELPRYFRALRIRAERAYAAPEKDRMKAEPFEPYRAALKELMRYPRTDLGEPEVSLLDEFRFMIEEYRISLFAPEIRTRFRVSPRRLDEKLREWKSWKGAVL